MVMVSDPVGDLIIRIKNGYLARKREIIVPASKFKGEILDLLVKEGFIEDYKIEKNKREFTVNLKYKQRKPSLTGVRRVSKPGVRIYVSRQKIPYVLGGHGIAVLSTSKGIMSGREAKEKKIGGELLFEIW